jgi:glucose/arabinose dehydrogenase
MRTGAVTLLLLSLASACASPMPADAPRAGDTNAAPSPMSSPSASPRTGPAVVVSVDVVAMGLEAPWAIDFAPDGRVFVTERPGRIRVIRNGTLDPTPWAVLPAAAGPDQERGLLGLAVDPDFTTSGLIYVYYTTLTGGRFINRLVRMKDEAGRGVMDRVLLDSIPGADTHDGGRLKFGPDQRLYLTVGDAQMSQLAQNANSPLGKILRLERDGSIPADNPFAGSPVFSLGHRHPQGLAFGLDGALYATEHGPSEAPPRCCHDEVNLIQPGGNYGWPRVFGVSKDAQFRDPVHESGTDTWAPSGAAFVTDGPLRGSLLFAALRGQHLRRLVLSTDGASVVFEERLLTNFGRLRDVVEGPDGSFYVLTQNRDGRGQPRAGDDRILRVVLG